MPGIMVPKSTLEDFGKARDSHFPEGTWIVALEEVREKGFPEFIGANVAKGVNAGYTSGEGEILGLQFGGARSADGTDDTNQKLFLDIITRDGEISVEAGPDIPESSWQMQRSATIMALLAQACGATEDVPYEGKTYTKTTDDFLEQLKAGEFNGTSFGVETYHRTYKRRDDAPNEKTGVEVVVREIFQAV